MRARNNTARRQIREAINSRSFSAFSVSRQLCSGCHAQCLCFCRFDRKRRRFSLPKLRPSRLLGVSNYLFSQKREGIHVLYGSKDGPYTLKNTTLFVKIVIVMSILAKMTANLTDLIIKLRSFTRTAIKAPGLRRHIFKNLRKVIAETKTRWPRRSGTGPLKIVWCVA